MGKKYITPLIKGHRILTPQILCGSNRNEIPILESGSNKEEGTGTSNFDGAKRAGNFFDDEEPAQSATKERDFAYGL